MSTSRFSLGWVLVAWLALAACSGTGPQLIGTYPKQTSSTTYATPPPDLRLVYNAYVDLEVADPDATAKQAVIVAEVYRGYLVNSDTWTSDGQRYTTLTLGVPVEHFDDVHAAVLRLGRVVRDEMTGDPADANLRMDEGTVFTNITLQLHTAIGPQFHLPAWGWNPVQTAEQAFGVFASVFTVVADVVIWVVVVLGPFVLMGWGAVSLVRKLRKR